MDLLKIILIVVAIFILYVIIVYNILTKKRMKVKQAKSGIDVYLQQRFDLIPNLVECVKKYCEYEKETLTEIAKLREAYNNDKSLETGKELNQKLDRLVAVAEAYPDLKADQQFLNLQKNLSKMENQLQAARRLYNIEVTSLNTTINVFPQSLIASAFGFKNESLFEIEDINAKSNVNIEL